MNAAGDRGPQTGPDAAVVDLLGVLACGELLAFERLAHDAALAPTIEDKAELARMCEYRRCCSGRAEGRQVIP